MNGGSTPPGEQQEFTRESMVSEGMNQSVMIHDNLVSMQKSQAVEMEKMLKQAEEHMPSYLAEQI